ncbi:hypothetical protein ACZ87_02067 [Candidatus Erwinia dacicola]|uniref:Uncharacterized protein n=1 Tax=Candidatus Erwinia dacicola TaxID=252393 RepID=A0A328TPW2_9GAMM|nr:hypothetical protein ACZ87_02067 [Candidatus Erwinia dacicola]
MLEWLASSFKTGILKQHDYLLFNKAAKNRLALRGLRFQFVLVNDLAHEVPYNRLLI